MDCNDVLYVFLFMWQHWSYVYSTIQNTNKQMKRLNHIEKKWAETKLIYCGYKICSRLLNLVVDLFTMKYTVIVSCGFRVNCEDIVKLNPIDT